MRALLFALLLLAFVARPAAAADATVPHPHQGILTSYPGAPDLPALSAEDLEALGKGETVRKQVEVSTGGRGIAVQDVAATPEIVWSRIVEYSKYPEWVDGVDACEVYGRSGEHINAYFQISAMGVSVEYYIDHVYRPADGYMTWTLDYSRESDLDDSVGFWRVMPHPEKPGGTRVYYSVDVRLRGWVPGFIQSMITKKGLIQATEWVKRESEEVAAGGSSP